MITSWSERYAQDATLQAFVRSQIVQAGIDVQAAKVEHERDQAVIKAQQREIAALRAEREKKKTARR